MRNAGVPWLAAAPEALETYRHEASSGNPLQLRLTALAIPEPPLTTTGTLTVSPAATVIVLASIVKPGGGP